MLIKPTLESLMKRVDSKYTLVTLAAKRARQLTDGDKPLVDVDTTKSYPSLWKKSIRAKLPMKLPRPA